MRAVRVVGLDGCRTGWVAVVLDGGRFASARLVESLAEAGSVFRDARVIGVDMPIGLPIGHGRECDRAAREFVGPRRNSVFLAFPRAVFAASTHPDAIQVAHRLTGAGISAQTYGLRAKVLEANHPDRRDRRFIEIHPEVSFRAMADRPLEHSKKTWNGMARRVALLRAQGIDLVKADVGDAGTVASDDLLDAAAAAWSAHRKAVGKARPLPAGTSPSSRGVIWY